MKKSEIIAMLLAGKTQREILPLLSEKEKAIYEMLKQGKPYKEIENSLQVFPANIAFIKRYLFKELPDSNTNNNSNTTLNSNTNKTPESEGTTLLNSAITTPNVELENPTKQKEEITKEPPQKNEPEIENKVQPIKEPEQRKGNRMVRRFTHPGRNE